MAATNSIENKVTQKAEDNTRFYKNLVEPSSESPTREIDCNTTPVVQVNTSVRTSSNPEHINISQLIEQKNVVVQMALDSQNYLETNQSTMHPSMLPPHSSSSSVVVDPDAIPHDGTPQ